MGVDIFLFLSAIGLCKSMGKNNTVIFYLHRFNRVLLPFLMIAIPFFVWLDLLYLKDGIGQLFLNVTTINYWLTGNHPTWYIAFILIMYLLFPLLYQWDRKTGHISTICLIFFSIVAEFVMYKAGCYLYNTSERALSRIPVFLIGLLTAPLALSNRRIPLWQVLMCFFGGVFLFSIISLHPPFIVFLRYMYCPIGVAIIICYTFLRQHIELNWLWDFLGWIGTFSLELYVVHVLLIRVLNVTNSWALVDPFLWWLFIPLVSLPIALLLHYSTKKILKLIHKSNGK